MTRYNRAPSGALLDLLNDDALLAPLLRTWNVAGLPLDLHFRENDELHLYCGLTRLVTASLKPGGVSLDADETYTEQPCAAELFRLWPTTASDFGDALAAYLADVQVGPRWVSKEGRVQAAWMAVEDPWVTLDREAVIGRESSKVRQQALDVSAVQAAFAVVDQLTIAKGWARPEIPKGANKLDQLAIDPTGRLVLVELKDAGSSEVVTAPLQALRYVWEWHAEVKSLLPSLNALVDARKRVGLAPPSTPDLNGQLRVAIAWGEGAPSAEVLRRMRAVKAIVDAHLPDGVAEVEVWALRNRKPYTSHLAVEAGSG